MKRPRRPRRAATRRPDSPTGRRYPLTPGAERRLRRRRRARLGATAVLLAVGALLLALGATAPGIALLVLGGVAAWLLYTAREARSFEREHQGEDVRLPDAPGGVGWLP